MTFNFIDLRKNDYIFLLIVSVLFLAINIALWSFLGWRTGSDTGMYLKGADYLIKGQSLSAVSYAHFGYIQIVALIKILGMKINAIYFFQIFLSLIACYAAYCLGRVYSVFVAQICGIFWSINGFHFFWNYYILTESIFASLIIITMAFYSYGLNGNKRAYVLALASIVILSSIRVNGFLYGSALLVCSVILEKKVSYRIICFVLLILIIGFLPTSPFALILLKIPSSEQPLLKYILDFTVGGEVNWHTVIIPMPKFIQTSDDYLFELLRYCFQYPFEVLNLCAQRVVNLLINYNPHFSTTHKVFNIVFFGSYHLFAIIGFVELLKKNIKVKAIAVIPLIQILYVAMTTNDYDGRYLLYTLTGELLFFAVGLAFLYTKGRDIIKLRMTIF
ncbi:MAG: hypothetical protein HQK51_10785 [Oligoflexia bacterium]|nr:hypothetical protein [Oligoflexia bacterium]